MVRTLLGLFLVPTSGGREGYARILRRASPLLGDRSWQRWCPPVDYRMQQPNHFLGIF